MVVAESANCCFAVFHWLRYVLGAPFWSIHSCGFIWPSSGVICWLPELTSASSFCASQGAATPPAASTCVGGLAGGGWDVPLVWAEQRFASRNTIGSNAIRRAIMRFHYPPRRDAGCRACARIPRKLR